MITQEELKKIVNYNPETGIFTWNISKQGIKFGKVAGGIKDTGYVRIKLNGKLYPAHRLAWIYMYGEYPNIIDHINGKRDDNRICNLRQCSTSQNQWNQKLSKNNTSGSKNVSWIKSRNKWRVQIKVNNIPKHIGYFDDFEFATFVAEEARDKYHKEFANNG